MKLSLQFAADSPAGPVVLELPKGTFQPGTVLSLRDARSGAAWPGQVDDAGRLLALAAEAKAAQTLEFELVPATTPAESPLTVEQADDCVSIRCSGGDFGVFRFGPDLARPIVWPLVGPGGVRLSRNWPMSRDDPDESTDHLHHQSFWVAHGDVNGVDHWSLAEGHGVQRVQQVTVTSGPVSVTIDATIDWLGKGDQRQLTERRQLVFWQEVGRSRFLDLISRFEIGEKPVRFGDTKEGGLCSIRVASCIEEQRGAGVITTGAGGRTEAQCWGKPAPWCDYSGPIAGRTAGVAILDHPGNFRHPTPWHVRAYGLMSANPFGLSYFTGDKQVDGSHTWQAGETVVFRYRIVLHTGDAQQADIAGQWRLFAEGPKADFA